MNVIKLLLAFAPWIVFGLISGQSFFGLEIDMVVSIAIALILGYKTMKKWYILPWVTFTFFVLAFITIVLMKNIWVAQHMKILSYMVLVAVAWGSILVGLPFTMQYAKEEVDKSLWKTKSFIRTNQIITAFWGAIFFVNLGISYYLFIHKVMGGWTFMVVGWVLILIGLVFTTEYTKLVRSHRIQNIN